MSMFGNDGREYVFLLKGHEDMRQDERVMQLFGLVNTLLSIDPQTSKKDLSIMRYSVIPLSQNTGLVGWVPNTDTLHQLIKEHRDQSRIIPNIEYKIMEEMCQHFDMCPLPNKVEIFRSALEKTIGEDLQKVLWLKSQNSELWLERRTNYTRSLAVMSMVGYILGLGDRHPSNIMLDRYTGKIVHIDFGDCFEVAMRREKFPEKIPFRLTRMLVKAMEVSGIEGNFRTTCENTMRVMRESRDSLLAILEAFVYDPLFSFRLLNPKMLKQHQEKKEAESKQHDGNQDPTDIMAEIRKNKEAAQRQQVIENVLDRFQSVNTGKQGTVKNYAESKFSRHAEDMELIQLMKEEGDEDAHRKELNQIAEMCIQRINDKLRGMEFHTDRRLGINQQVDTLIKQATSHENLAQCYIGWCPFW